MMRKTTRPLVRHWSLVLDNALIKATLESLRAKRNSSIRARMRVAQYKGLDDEDEDADPSYKQPKSRANGHAYASEDDGTSGDDERDQATLKEPPAAPLSKVETTEDPQLPDPAPPPAIDPPPRATEDALTTDKHPVSSREGSPVPSAKDTDDEEEGEEEQQRMSLAGVSKQRRASLLESAGVTDPHADITTKPDQDVDMAADADPDDNDNDNDEDNGEGDQEGDVDVEGDGQGDGEPDDEDHDNDLESDLQPAHRAEALDVLAGIELRWALLRERIYVEKMDGLTWEENLVKQGTSSCKFSDASNRVPGTHPEMLHLLGELTTRRDKRIELASKKRVYEIANIGKRRRAEESATWSWWEVSRSLIPSPFVPHAVALV